MARRFTASRSPTKSATRAARPTASASSRPPARCSPAKAGNAGSGSAPTTASPGTASRTSAHRAVCHARGMTPSYIAGFRAFLHLNRCVRKGETAVHILAPVAVKQRDQHGAETAEKKVFFRTVPVWDVAMTDPLPGKEPVPLPPPSQPITGDSHQHLIAPLIQHARGLGYTVEIRQLRTTARAAGVTPSASRSSSPAGPRTARSARLPTSLHMPMGSATRSTGGSRPKSLLTASRTACSARSASMSGASRSPTSQGGAKTARWTRSASMPRRSTRSRDRSKTRWTHSLSRQATRSRGTSRHSAAGRGCPPR